MDFNDLCPIWVIDTLSEDDSFCKEMDRQLGVYSANEFGSIFNLENHRWWKTERAKKVNDIKIDDNGYPEGIPVYHMDAGNFDVHQLTVVLLCDYDSFDNALAIVKDLQSKNKNGSLLKGSGNVIRYFGLLVFKKNSQLSDNLKKVLLDSAVPAKSKKTKAVEPLPFDTLFLQGNCNRIGGSNGSNYSYVNLNKEDTIDLSVQIVFHLALSQGVLSNVNNKQLCVAGAFSVNYEPEKNKAKIAEELTNVIVDKFLHEEKGEHWHKESEATISEVFTQDHGWGSVYGTLKAGYKNLDTKDIYPQSPVSPWRLVLKDLLPKYYRKYIKSLVRQINDNTTAFSFLTLGNYENLIDNHYKEISGETLRRGIETELSTIWDRENKDCTSIGMQQFKSRMEKMEDFFKAEKEKTNRLLNPPTSTGEKSTFPELADLPLGNFGEFHDKFAEYFTNEGTKPIDNQDSISEGKLRKLTRLLSFHPISLSLLTRSILTGILMPMIMLTTLKLVPDILFNTARLESYPGSLIFIVSCFLLSVGCAVLKFHFGVVDAIKQNVKDYVGWCLYLAQVKAYRKTLEKAVSYYDDALAIIANIRTQVDGFVLLKKKKKKKEKEEDYGLVTNNEEGFKENKFQADILSTFEGKNLLKVDAVTPKVNVSLNEFGEEKSMIMKIQVGEDKKDELHYGVLRWTLIVKDDKLLQQLKSVLFKNVSENNSDEDVSNDEKYYCDTEIYKELTRSIKNEIVFYLDSQLVDNLTDLVFSESGDPKNVNKWDIGGVEYSIGRCIFERSYPSAETLSASSAFSLVMPNRGMQTQNDFGFMKKLLTVDVSSGYDLAKGSFLFSIFQGASVSSISQIKDIII